MACVNSVDSVDREVAWDELNCMECMECMDCWKIESESEKKQELEV